MILKSVPVFFVSVITFRFFSPSSGKKHIRTEVFWNLERKSSGLYSSLLMYEPVHLVKKGAIESLPGRGNTSGLKAIQREADVLLNMTIETCRGFSLSSRLSVQCWVKGRNGWSHENYDHSSGNPGLAN